MKDTYGVLIRQRHDETLYSMLARLGRYLNISSVRQLTEAFFNDRVSCSTDLPNGLSGICGSGIFGLLTEADAIRDWTSFPYYARFSAPKHWRAAYAALLSPGGVPSSALGSWSWLSPKPDRLRFCRSCHGDMLEQFGELWWMRSHQLPSSTYCADHGEALRLSTVTRGKRDRDLFTASAANCPLEAPPAIEAGGSRQEGDLIAIARAGDLFLDLPFEHHPDDYREDYLQQLDQRGILNRAGEADLGKLAIRLEAYWGDTLGVWEGLRTNGRCSQAWLGRLLLSGDHCPPLHHILLAEFLEARSWRR